MMRRKLHVVLLLAAIPLCKVATAQLYIDNAQFFIQPGATVTVQGDVTSNTDIQGTGKVLLKGSANQNVNMNGFTIPNLEIENTANVTLTGNSKISGDLNFVAGKLQLGSYNLTVGSAGTISNPTSAKYVVTNGTGKLLKTGLSTTAFTFPVGNTTGTYNPVTIANSGTADEIGVRALASAYTAGLTGAAITKEVVDASWDISEANAGGSNLSLTASWSATDELTGFNRTKGGISYYVTAPSGSVGWNLLYSEAGAATGTNPYTYTKTGITSLGTFAVGGRGVYSQLLAAPKLFLQGPYNTGTSVMNDNLRTANLIPPTEPYTGLANFTHVGSGGGETTTTAVVGSSAANGDNNVVDWVFLQIHDATTKAVVATKSALLQKDGDIVDLDGLSPVNFPGYSAANYYISVRHRNHLGARSLGTVALAKTTATAFNFTNDLAQVFAGTPAVSNPVEATVKTGVFGLYGGNTVADANVRATGPSAINDATKLIGTIGSAALISNTYNVSDVNMDGTVRSTGPSTINDYTKLIGIIGSKSLISQPNLTQ